VKCNGKIVVEDHVYIGTGAVIKQGRPGQPLVIGRGAVIGHGGGGDEGRWPPGMVVVNPARPLGRGKRC